MQYAKPSLTYEQQADLILQRGMSADRAQLVRRLKAVGYYRLCAYWHTFRQPDDTFQPGTTLEAVWNRYMFDRKLRLLVMDAIERVEVAIRCALVDELSLLFGPFAHLEARHFRGGAHADFVENLRREARRSSEAFVQHFRATYDEFPDLPIWAAAGTMSFGAMFTLYKMSPPKVKKVVAHRFALEAPVLESWLQTLNYIRNVCAHHSRLWNRTLAIRPMIPRHDVNWRGQHAVSSDKMYVVLTQLQFLMLQIAPHSRWRERLVRLLDDFPQIQLTDMGIPADWRAHPIWC